MITVSPAFTPVIVTTLPLSVAVATPVLLEDTDNAPSLFVVIVKVVASFNPMLAEVFESVKVGVTLATGAAQLTVVAAL